MLHADFPILEHDDSLPAIIEPSQTLTPIDMPEHVVLCFFPKVVAQVGAEARVCHNLFSELGENPIYETAVGGKRLAFVHPGVGASFCAAVLEELIALGGRKFIACGSAGALRSDITAGHLVIPTSAVRDEGTSYHYLPPGRDVSSSTDAVAAVETTLRKHNVPYVAGKTWTTDAIYRETPAKVARRRDEGCLVVEMECAAFFAVAQFRGVTFGQVLYGGDDLSTDTWDMRDFIHGQATLRERLFWLAAEACLSL